MSITIALPIGYKPVFKHGDHDQSSHGSWATGNFDEESEVRTTQAHNDAILIQTEPSLSGGRRTVC
jgi:hypothetical protein